MLLGCGVLVGVVVFSGCGGGVRVPVPTVEMAGGGGEEELAVLRRGYEVYTGECRRCHGAILPAERSAVEWVGLTREMAVRAGISPADEAAVLKYVLAAR